MRRPLLILAFWLLPWVAQAQVAADRADVFAEATDLDTQAELFAAQIGPMLQMQAGQLPGPAQEPFRELFLGALDPTSLQARARAYIIENADPQRLDAALAYLGDPLVAQMQELEMAAAQDPSAQVAVQVYTNSGRLGRRTISPEREALANRYLEATGAGDASVDLILDLVTASSRMNAALFEVEAPPEEMLRAQMRPQLEGQLQTATRGQTLYAFRDLSDEDFEAYVERSDDPAARYANELASSALGAAVGGAIEDAGGQFVHRLEALDAQGELDLSAWRAQVRAQQEAMQQQAAPGGQE